MTRGRDAFDGFSAGNALELQQRGFVVVAGPVSAAQMPGLSDAYDAAVASATAPDLRIGSRSTRVSDFVNRGAAFDGLYVFPPLLDACRALIGGPFKLSTLHARTLAPHTPAEELHVDLRRDSADWPLLAFILMIDAFRPDNGATRFLPGSQDRPEAPNGLTSLDGTVQACGPAGSLLIFNGSTWHGHGANTTDSPRRSLQGAFIPRSGTAATDFAGRMTAATRARLSPLALDLLLA